VAQSSAARMLRGAEVEALERVRGVITVNPYSLRVARPADVSSLEDIEHEAFPTLSMATPFRREVKRENSLYVTAVRPWTYQEQREYGIHVAYTLGLLGRLRRLTADLLFKRATGIRPTAHEYIAGVVGLWFVLDECHVVIIASRLRERRKGVGELLLIGALEAAIARGSRMMTLEVRASNDAARTLYRKYGFQDVGLRKRYYNDNNEDAVIMTTPPIQTEEYHRHFELLVRAHVSRWGRSVRAVA
jgi:[ribosomal protein S18]-alanine N-acetyltransferase